MKRIFSLSVLLFLALLGGCKRADHQAAGKVQVIATIFPVYDFARTIGGEKADVKLLLPPGVEPHNYEPRPDDILRINRSSLFIYTDRYMEPWAESLLKGAGRKDSPKVVEAGKHAKFLPAAGQDHAHHDRVEAFDPHVWLDPTNAMSMVDTISAAMQEKDPANGAYYQTRTDRLKAEIAALDVKFRSGLAGCRQVTFLHGGHYAFAYLARRYGLSYRSAYAISASAEPTPQRVAELVREMRRLGLNYIFTEELISPAMAETIARETGAKILKLHGIHTVSRDDLDRGVTYVSLMEENLQNLRIGLQCP